MIGQRLRKIRKDVLKITQAEMSNTLYVKRNSLSRLENGIQELNSGQIARLMEVYKINPTWLLSGKGNMFLEEAESEEIKKGDINLLTEIIYLSEKACIKLNAKIDPKKKAEQIVKLFLHYKEEEQQADEKAINTILKLVS